MHRAGVIMTTKIALTYIVLRILNRDIKEAEGDNT